MALNVHQKPHLAIPAPQPDQQIPAPPRPMLGSRVLLVQILNLLKARKPLQPRKKRPTELPQQSRLLQQFLDQIIMTGHTRTRAHASPIPAFPYFATPHVRFYRTCSLLPPLQLHHPQQLLVTHRQQHPRRSIPILQHLRRQTLLVPNQKVNPLL